MLTSLKGGLTQPQHEWSFFVSFVVVSSCSKSPVILLPLFAKKAPTFLARSHVFAAAKSPVSLAKSKDFAMRHCDYRRERLERATRRAAA